MPGDAKKGVISRFFGARAFGVWDNRISDTEYVQRIQENQRDPASHPGM